MCEKVHPTDSHKTFSWLWTLIFKWLRPADFCQFECTHITSDAPRNARCLHQRHLRWNRCYFFTLKPARSCHIHTLMSTRMMEGGRGLSRCTRIRRTRRLIKLTPPSSLAFSAFLHFSFRHLPCARSLFLFRRTRLLTLSFVFSRHPLRFTSFSRMCDMHRWMLYRAILATTHYFLLVINSTWLSIWRYVVKIRHLLIVSILLNFLFRKPVSTLKT